VLIGGGGERKTLRMVARHADIWHSFSDLDTFKRKSEVLAGWCAEFDRDVSEIERSVGVQPGRAAETGPAYLEAGARLFTIGLGGPSYDLSAVRDWVTWRDSL
jgi:alkanesulfonate monooxygenase SsuD/methylene tetrahydromethanopterin reductase-like flavin-dependent oxidoreductase (luciferase family)